MKYCDFCNTWIKNHPAAIAMHEQGAKHKASKAARESGREGGWPACVGGKARAPHKTHHTSLSPPPPLFPGLQQQRDEEEQRAKDESAAKRTLAAAESEATTQYAADQAAAAAAREALGTWVRERGKGGGWLSLRVRFACLFILAPPPLPPYQDDDESGHLYNAKLRYYYNK